MIRSILAFLRHFWNRATGKEKVHLQDHMVCVLKRGDKTFKTVE